MNTVPPEASDWFKDAVIYQLHVRSFCDSGADGIGDFRGLRDKLDYFEALGVTALWLLPFYPSPLRDDGYDIADYYSVNPSYGTLDDFREFLDEAHRRGLRVITELVINHTSDQHPWFQRARLAPAGSEERDFYVWSDTPKRYEEARIIFQDFESSNWAWDPVAQAYYWHRFYSHQPDINFDHPPVRQAVLDVMDFWLEMGVDGLRLDAVPYLFEREGTMCENLPETHAYLKDLRTHIDTKFPGRMLLAEANQWPEDAAAYFGEGDECHMAFHFPLMPRLFMALQMEDRFPVLDILDQTPAIPANCQWAIFLRNHDELTLEMVTDEERDYMVRIYAEDARARINLGIRRRLAPLLRNNRRKIELINSLLLSLPGTPIVYYGDEIGMGDNIYLGDRNGVRTPMQWSADRNAGFSRANPQQLYLPIIIDPEFHYETINVDLQQKNLSSLFWWTRRILGVRRKHPAFARGTIEFLPSENPRVLAYLRRHESETLLVVANLSRFSQAVPLDLAEFRGWFIEELFGHTAFPPITDAPYLFTLGPDSFYWFALRPTAAGAPVASAEQPAPTLDLPPRWSPALQTALERRVLPHYLPRCRWFGGKQQTVREVRITADFAAPPGGENGVGDLRLVIVEITFADAAPTQHCLVLGIAADGAGDPGSQSVVARFASGEVLWDALFLPAARERLLAIVRDAETWRAGGAKLSGVRAPGVTAAELAFGSSRLLGAEQSNSSVAYGDQWIAKCLRRFETGAHPDAQILGALGDAGFPHVPRYAGEIRVSRGERDEGVVALFAAYVANQGDGWTFTLDSVGRYFERVLATPLEEPSHGGVEPGELFGGNYAERIRQLGIRSGELHVALAGLRGPAFAPERFTALTQRALYQALRNHDRRNTLDLRRGLLNLPEEWRDEARACVDAEAQRLALYKGLLGRRLESAKIRVHGDYHLGQVLNTGKDFVILDFEGEPRRSLGERLLKRSPLVDVAGMIRSLDYAAQTALGQQRPEDLPRLRPAAESWRSQATRGFLEGYLTGSAGASFLPPDREELAYLLRVFLLEKAIYEVGYELSYRPHFVSIPLRAARRIIEGADELELGTPEPVPADA